MKKGNSLVIAPITIIVGVFIIIAVSIYLINSFIPFIYYEKINNISDKYIFVIEKFGYLTKDEYNSLILELKESGININNIIITYPKDKKNYGELLTLEIKYNFEKDIFLMNNSNTMITIRKNCYSKI